MPVTFNLYSDLSREAKTQVREFNATMKVFLNPNSANPIEMGEYFQLDTTVTSGEYMTRANGATTSFPYYLERGRPEPQILGRGSFLWTTGWTADTLLVTPAGLTIGCPLKVGAAVVYDTLNKSGLLLHTGAPDADYVVGHALRLPAANNSFLKYQAHGPYRMV